MDMEFVKMDNFDSREFKEAWTIYESSFPSDERRDFGFQSKLMANKSYRFFKILRDNVLVAIIDEWDFDSFLFVEHLAVRADFRGMGIGTELLKEYIAKNRRIVLEVEKPVDDDGTKRMRYYERAGFKRNDFNYIQPPYGKDKSPVPMFLMTFPERINESEFSSIRQKLHTVVYGLKKPLINA